MSAERIALRIIENREREIDITDTKYGHGDVI